jgi:tRNA (guanine37-N1)-methyltransferase
LKEHWLPYKHLIGEVILDKNPIITTVINKVKMVGTESVFRTFPYEVLAGPDDLEVSVSVSNCVFRFNYGKVYWNQHLEAEHERVTAMFKPGEVIVDVMAGVGPFAVPAGKRGVFVWANDLNPACFDSLEDAITRNKVSHQCSLI